MHNRHLQEVPGLLWRELLCGLPQVIEVTCAKRTVGFAAVQALRLQEQQLLCLC